MINQNQQTIVMACEQTKVKYRAHRDRNLRY